MRFINNTRLRFGWAFAAGLAAFPICTLLSVLLVVCLDRIGAGGNLVGYFPPYPRGTPFRGVVWLYYLSVTLYWLGLAGLAFAFIAGTFKKKTAIGVDDPKSFTWWNAQLAAVPAITFSSIPVLVMFAWFGRLVPYLRDLLKPLQEISPFLHDILQTLILVLVLPCSFGTMVFALYFYQRRWNRLHT